jgi:hypothetical protein
VTLLAVAPLTAMLGGASASAATDNSVLAPVHSKHLSGSPLTKTGSLGGCTLAATGGKGQLSSFLASGATVTWTNGTTTTYASTFTISGTLCPTGSTEFNIKGSVTVSTNASIPVGAPVRMTACLMSTITNAPNSRVAI